MIQGQLKRFATTLKFATDDAGSTPSLSDHAPIELLTCGLLAGFGAGHLAVVGDEGVGRAGGRLSVAYRVRPLRLEPLVVRVRFHECLLVLETHPK